MTTVIEPDPNNASPSSNPLTYYYLNGAGQTAYVSVLRNGVSQNRSYTWGGTDLVSSTEPETRTTTYQYDGSHHVTRRTDAKAQQTRYYYDAYERLIEVRHYAFVLESCNGCGLQFQELTNQRVDYAYDSNPIDGSYSQYSWGRLTAATYTFQSGSGNQFAYLYSYNQAGRVTGNRLMATDGGSNLLVDLKAVYTWDAQGRMTNMTYPSGPALAYQYDAMGRLSGLTQNGSAIATAGYTPVGQLSTLQYSSLYESRTYNNLMQLTHLTNVGVDMQYLYTAGQNNGRVTQTIDGVLGETVNYQYDMWNRLTNATATNGSWGEQFTFDGFGNLTGKTPTAGSAPSMSVGYDPTTNRPTGASFDTNGNPTPGGNGASTYTWDVENRLVTTGAYTSQAVDYGYDPWGRRMWKDVPAPQGSPDTGEIYFYGATGQKLETYSFTNGTTFGYGIVGINMYFGGKLLVSKGVWVATDRLGSVRSNSNGESMSYYPYGEERTSTADGREKFGTYTRDGVGQDYAGARYFSANAGAFWSPDPSGLKAVNPRNPITWNRYTYVNDDPINGIDPNGLNSCIDEFGLMGGHVFDLPGCADPALEGELAYDSMVAQIFARNGSQNSTPDANCVQDAIGAAASGVGLDLLDFTGISVQIVGTSSGSGGTYGETELNLSGGNVQGLIDAMCAAGFYSNGKCDSNNTPLVGPTHTAPDGTAFTGNFRSPGLTNSVQVNTNVDTGQVQIDVDPYNPAAYPILGAILHGVLQFLPNKITGGDNTYGCNH